MSTIQREILGNTSNEHCTMSGKTVVDLLIHARWVLPIRPSAKTVLTQHSLAVQSGRIVDLLPTQQAARKYSGRTELHRPQHALMPGLVNVHTHSGMTLMRGCADDSNLHNWLRKRVWPIEGAFVTADEFCHDGAMLTAAEMTRGGTTCFNDMYWDLEGSARAVIHSGLRAILGITVIGFPTGFGKSTEDYLERGEKARKMFANESRIGFAYCPHAPYTVVDEAWKKIAALAKENDMMIHTHVHETAEEVNASVSLDRESNACHMSEFAGRPFANLARLGVLDARVLAVHMAHTNEEDIELCREHNVSVAHCPVSNAKLAVGWCNVAGLLENGVNVALGTDSACSNNRLDMLQEMRLGALFAKNLSGDASVVDAPTALEMGTINGAKALGLDEKIGSLEVGKLADVITVEVGTNSLNSPVFSIQSALVYAASRSDVCDVFVDGECLMRERELLKLEEKVLVERAQAWAYRIEEKFPLNE